MKKTFILFFFLVSVISNAQVFNGGGGPILNNGGEESIFDLNVSGLPSQVDSIYGLEEVMISITHPAVQELSVDLLSPSGIRIGLSGVLSCKGADFSSTCFSWKNHSSITLGTAPYTGTFNPVGNLGRVNNGKSGNGTWKLVIKDFVPGNNSGALANWSLKFTNTPGKPVYLSSSNLPIVFINTNSQVITDTEIIVNFGVVDNGPNRNSITDPRNNYDGKASCHIRGSSSKMFEKMNLKIELKDNSGVADREASLLGMPAESDWVLTASYSDKTLMRNALTHYLFTGMGHYSPRFRFVEVMLNGEYYGVYLLMEQPKRGKDRVNIDKMTPLDNQYPYITGGYMIQINRVDDPGWYSLNPGVSATSAKFYYQYNYPKPADMTSQQKAYIKSVLDSFELVMTAPNFGDPKTGYRKFISEDSFIDFMILNELSKNIDGYKLSTYIYKDNVLDGGKLRIGPMWDYDLAWHNCDYGDAFNDLYWQYVQPNDDYPIPTWWIRFMQETAFRDRLYCRYKTFRQNILNTNGVYAYIDQLSGMLNEAQQRNFRQFPIIGAYIFPNPQNQAGATYQKEVDDLKNWVGKRTAWVDANIPGFCNNVGVAEVIAAGDGIQSFPNPFSGELTVVYTAPRDGAPVVIEIFDLPGKQLLALRPEMPVAGAHSVKIDLSGLADGPYILKVSAGEKRSYQKIIKAGY